jgi:hypothetical protein
LVRATTAFFDFDVFGFVGAGITSKTVVAERVSRKSGSRPCRLVRARHFPSGTKSGHTLG